MPRLCLKVLGQKILVSPSHCSGPWSQLCLVGWTGVKSQCCASALQGQGMCAVPQLSPELLSCSGREARSLCPAGCVPGRAGDSNAGTGFCPCLVTPQSLQCQGCPGHGRQRLPAGRSRDELIVYPQHREREALPGSGQDLALPQPSALRSWAEHSGAASSQEFVCSFCSSCDPR